MRHGNLKRIDLQITLVILSFERRFDFRRFWDLTAKQTIYPSAAFFLNAARTVRRTHMFRFGLKLFSRQITSLSAPGFAVLLLLVVPVAVTAQRSKGDSGDDKPIFSEFRGVHLGMTTEEARKKLGSPRDKSDEQDFY